MRCHVTQNRGAICGILQDPCNRGKTCGDWHSGGLAPTADKVWQIRHDRLAGNAEAIAKVVPECEAKFGSGAHQSEECVAAVAARETAMPPPLTLRLVT